VPISQRLERIATQAREYPDMAFTTLAHHLDVAMLAHAFRSLNPQSAPGVDRVTWRTYKNNLETNLETLYEKLVNETYCPQAVVRRLIPKGDGKLRPLGLPALEDKIVAKAVAMLMEAIYEQDFCDFSYGFRRGRSPHQALQEVRQGLLGSRIGYVIDCDISAFFDNLQHDPLLAILRKRVNDGRGLEFIELWLKAGILDGKERVFPEKGSPQGSVSTPPTKLQTFFFGIRISSVRIDPKHDIDLIPGYFHPLHQGPDEIPLARPVGCLQSAVDFGRKIVESANNQL
jgi:retron-type reverse transcriptase